jgi:transposase
VIATQAEAACPICGQLARRVQSHYTRTLADLPWATMRVQLHLHVRRFFCANPACPRKIFTERLRDLVVAYARRTNRLRDQLLAAGFALGGEAGARHCVESSRGQRSHFPRRSRKALAWSWLRTSSFLSVTSEGGLGARLLLGGRR